MRIICFAVALASLGSMASAQQQPAPFEIRMLAKGVYWVNGGGGNSGVIIGHKGVTVIDAKTTADGGKQLLAEVAKLTPLPVTSVILTHSDGDHVNGLAAFPDGLTIIAHENNKKEQEAALEAGGRGAPPANRLPNKLIVKDKESFKVDGIPFQFYHWGPAHTSGDLIVFLPVQKIVFTGDIVATQRLDPIIHLEKNGSTEGWIKTMQGIIALNAKTYVPGHGDIQDKFAVESRLQLVQAKHDKIKALIAQGKPLPDIKAAVGDPAPPATPGRGPAFGNLTDIMYAESTKK
ncbi:MAG TPA: MBL fold metallo-hydrolase [Bryobacteraceae bacterium]|jgi:glyoxylase-like metal-dependent hydrolase (beta-lactamase superfamily II)|nr:MBL fold metallo-hydrolase [Bryobacteraceae bacterium]